MTRALTPVLALLVLAACGDSFDDPSIVRTSRILAIVVEPPEIEPGEDASFRAMISIPEDVPRPLSLRWRRCLTPEAVLDQTGIPIDFPGDPACPDPIELAEDEAYVVPGAESQALVDVVHMAAMFGGFDATLFDSILGTAGLAYIVDVEVLDANGEIVVAGYKRGGITTRDPPTTNPPFPVFRAGEQTIVGTEELFRCASIEGMPPRFAPDTDVELEPLFGEEDWIETFPIFDYTGALIEGRENAYYGWFATGGTLGPNTTRPPERMSTWHTPLEPGPQSLWLVIRDGHLGTSACRIDVEIAAP